jgi:hypothetical protein
MFARYITGDVDSKYGKISENSLEKVAHVCNGIRKKLTMNYRELIILTQINLSALDPMVVT